MIMLRSFLPVGQGSFCLEQFKNGENKINIVYDCGTSTKSFDINKEIRANFDKGEDILIVFISHLHEDHVNGLEYLLNYCNVKNIIFPLTSVDIIRNNMLIIFVDYNIKEGTSAIVKT